MDETTNTQTNSLTPEERTAESARRIMNPDYAARRVAVGAAAIGIGAALLAGGQAIPNEIKHNDRVASVTAEYENDQNILNEIKKQSLAPVDPASIVGIFDITEGTTINSESIKIVESLPAYQSAGKTQQEWIDFALLESGKAQGSYDLNEKFAVTEVEINGKSTYVVQDGNDIQQ
jgi:hypothetical protein